MIGRTGRSERKVGKEGTLQNRKERRYLVRSLEKNPVSVISTEVVPQLKISRERISIENRDSQTERKIRPTNISFREPFSERPGRKLAEIDISGIHDFNSICSPKDNANLGLSSSSYQMDNEPKSTATPLKKASTKDFNPNNSGVSSSKGKLKKTLSKYLRGLDFGSKRLLQKNQKKVSPKEIRLLCKFRKVDAQRQKEIDKFMVRVAGLRTIIVNSVAELFRDFKLIEKSDFSILTDNIDMDNIESINDHKYRYFNVDANMMMAMIDNADCRWFDDYKEREDKGERICNGKGNENALGRIKEKTNDDSVGRWSDEPSARINDFYQRTEDVFMMTGTTWSSRGHSPRTQFDKLYHTFYGSEFDEDVNKSALDSPTRFLSTITRKYKPPIGQSKVNCKQSNKRKNKSYAEYSYKSKENLTDLLRIKSMEYVYFSLNHSVSFLLLLHTSKFMMENNEKVDCINLLILALNISLLFEKSQLSAWAYKSIGDYYSSQRTYDIAQLSYTRALQHSLVVNDRQLMIRMFDQIGKFA